MAERQERMGGAPAGAAKEDFGAHDSAVAAGRLLAPPVNSARSRNKCAQVLEFQPNPSGGKELRSDNRLGRKRDELKIGVDERPVLEAIAHIKRHDFLT